MEKTRNYLYYDQDESLCSKDPDCLRRVPAKVILKDNRVFMDKYCREHGHERVLLSTDANYYRQGREVFLKHSEMPGFFQTKMKYNCPYDCGLCPDHEQHSCLTLIEITDRCNLSCPTCFTLSSPSSGSHRSLDEVKKMMDLVVRSEGEPDVVQISGGEPTVHPQFFEILDEAKKRPIKNLMVNTNGVRIAREPGFADRLAQYMPRLEMYLQFDSFKSEALTKIRGEDLTDVRYKAIEHLNERNFPATLVSTLQRGVNTDEIGKIIKYGLEQRSVRGVTFQPTQRAGRNDNFNPVTERYTLTEVRQAILDQTSIFQPNDIIPVPCNPDSIFMGYALRFNGQVHPLTRYLDPKTLIEGARNTIVFEHDPQLRKSLMMKIFSTGSSHETASDSLQTLLCCLPQVSAPSFKYENLFRIIGIRFMDAYDFSVRAVKKSCVHIVDPKGEKLIPIETMNLFYRQGMEEKLRQLREEIVPSETPQRGVALPILR
ncbi:radical SAM protein [Candidatus Pacearchaeota archaeon]|nr:radical SAM protein [Candidatus Pacearchaeota archaeon]